MDKTPKMVIGLGNPDEEYFLTYHNIGRRLSEYLTKEAASGDWKNSSKNFSYLKERGVIFVRPGTYMNDSGKAVKAAIEYFKEKTEELLVVHDDSDILIGEYKYSFGRNSAGHKGIDSIIKALKTKDFWRLRIGIRKNSKKHIKASDLVLKKISKNDEEEFKKIFKTIKKSIWLN